MADQPRAGCGVAGSGEPCGDLGNFWACMSIPSVEELLVLHVEQTGADLLRRGADGQWPRDPERLSGGDLVLDWSGPLKRDR